MTGMRYFATLRAVTKKKVEDIEMATTTLSQRRQGVGRGRWLWIGSAAIVLAILAALLLTRTSSSSSTSTVSTTTVTSGSLVASVAGSGTVAAAQSLDLTFQTSGSVTQVLVKEGDLVKADQPLAAPIGAGPARRAQEPQRRQDQQRRGYGPPGPAGSPISDRQQLGQQNQGPAGSPESGRRADAGSIAVRYRAEELAICPG